MNTDQINGFLIHIPKTRFGNAGRLVVKGFYAGGGVALGVNSDRGPECTATVNMVDHPLPAGEVWLKGWSENKGVPEALEASGAVKLTGRVAAAGFESAQHAELLFEVPAP